MSKRYCLQSSGFKLGNIWRVQRVIIWNLAVELQNEITIFRITDESSIERA